MPEILEKMYYEFCKVAEVVPEEKELEEMIKAFIDELDKAQKEKFSEIMDTRGYIAAVQKQESFICGLKVGMGLVRELEEHEQ